jgi:hypothetical protein
MQWVKAPLNLPELNTYHLRNLNSPTTMKVITHQQSIFRRKPRKKNGKNSTKKIERRIISHGRQGVYV